MNPVFAAAYVALIGATVAVELAGVARKRRGDTISEGFWWVEARLPAPLRWLLRVFTVGLLGWTALHLLAGVG